MTLNEALERLLASRSILVASDFDGVLSPLVDRPEQAVPHPRAHELLEEIAGRDNIEVAVVSGRSFTDLQDRLGRIAGITYVGEHGNDTGKDVEATEHLQAAIAFIEDLRSRMPAATVEHKQRSVTFHTRNLTTDDATRAGNEILEWAEDHDITLLEGKDVYEMTTATRTKGDAVTELAGGRPIIYLGDDVTDEAVFERLGDSDVGVKVGEGPTAAGHRVEDVAGVVAILEMIALASR